MLSVSKNQAMYEGEPYQERTGTMPIFSARSMFASMCILSVRTLRDLLPQVPGTTRSFNLTTPFLDSLSFGERFQVGHSPGLISYNSQGVKSHSRTSLLKSTRISMDADAPSVFAIDNIYAITITRSTHKKKESPKYKDVTSIATMYSIERCQRT
jgi:hypothetical protein